MIKETIEKAINDQVNAEYYSAYLYLSMSSYFSSKNLPGFASWMHVQYQEEITHVMKFINYLNERGGRVKLQAIEAPTIEWNSPLHAFENALAHEESITEKINKLVDLAIAQSDHASNNFLQWYVSEQVEEEATAADVVAKLKMVEESNANLYLLDQELGQRVFVDSTQTA